MARSNTRRMNLLRDEFLAEGRKQSESDDPEVRDLSECWLCKMPIDYVADPHSTDDSHNLDHYFIVRDYPELEEDVGNFRHAHRLCNLNRGTKSPSLGLGTAVADWW
ncbi:hypothetical protein [Cryobacterium sp. Y57]|uniref:hypothetical protein n=1 Tax=Cryobacterium sp. Y57 TaxID=2048287 RepID=UPI000CE355A7|nr:hypothetical protein [Cryobacterium sp. Y57]